MNKIEVFLLNLLCASLLILTVSGTINWLTEIPELIKQALSLWHFIVGLFSFCILLYFSYKHSKRTLGYRRPFSVFLGVICTFLLILSFISGVYIAFSGATKANASILKFHDLFSYLTLLVLFFHLLAHRIFFPKRRVNQDKKIFTTVSFKLTFYLLFGLLGLALGASSLLYLNEFKKEDKINPLTSNYSYKYGEGKFFPSLATTKGDEFILKDDIARSMDCVACHQTIGEQWLSSAHKHAAEDPTYVRNINLLEAKKGIEATRYCEGCHAPVALLSGDLTTGGEHGGKEGTVANFEGVGCMSCHGVTDVHSTKGVASFQFSPRSMYLFEDSTVSMLQSISLLSIKLRPKMHRSELLAPVQKTSEFCSSCHTQFMDKSMNEWGYVKMQDEFLAWNESKFSQPSDTRFIHPESKNCQACHMPMVEGIGLGTDKNGLVKSHYFVGANVALAEHFGHEELVSLTKDFMQKDKVSIYIVPPENETLAQTKLFFDPSSAESQKKNPVSLYRGETKEITVLVNNNGVGHNFPGGSIDLNEAWIQFKILDANQREVFSSGYLEEDGNIEPNATVYKEVAIDRFGKKVWRHDLFNMVGKSYQNVVPAGGTDIVTFEVTMPDWAVSPLHLSASLKYRKFNQDYFNWVQKGVDMKVNPIIEVSRNSLYVPLLKSSAVAVIP